jgi:hypothetical protein
VRKGENITVKAINEIIAKKEEHEHWGRCGGVLKSIKSCDTVIPSKRKMISQAIKQKAIAGDNYQKNIIQQIMKNL